MSDFDDIDLPEPQPLDAAEGGAFDQADIDALFGDVGSAGEPRTGVRALIENNLAGQERLPLLEVICDRLPRTFATSMRQLTSDAMEVNLEEVGSGRFGDLMNRAALPAMFGVFRIDPWGGHGVITIEPGLIYAVVDALLGGRKGAGGALRVEGRAFTTIETALVGRIMELVLQDFATAFELVASIQPQLERIETAPRFAAITGPAIGTAQCVFRVELDGRGGRFGLLLPITTLEPVRDKLTQRFMGDRIGTDNSWQEHLERELRGTPLRVEAVLAERAMSLREVAGLRVGDTVPLLRSDDGAVHLCHEGRALAAAQLGQRNNLVSLRLLGQINGASA